MVPMKNRINHQIEYKHDQQQLTLTLPAAPCPSSNRHLNRSRRLRRATAWFTHMRNVVDLAPDPIESTSSSAVTGGSEMSARSEPEKKAA